MQRRKFLKFGLATPLVATSQWLSWVPRAHAAVVSRTYFITQGNIVQPDGVSVFFKGFSDSSTTLRIPGQSLIVKEGDTISLTITNTLTTSHSFVIDGVIDSGTIAAGQSKSLSFAAPAAGSYMFYDKLNAPYNRLLGLHGGLAVMPSSSSYQLYAGSPSFKKQLFWIFNDIDPAWHERLRTNLVPNTTFLPRYFTLNGKSSRPPGAPGYEDTTVNSLYDPATKLEGFIDDRTLIRALNAGQCTHSMHWHANHVEWLTQNRTRRSTIWLKDVVPLDNNLGSCDVIYPFEPPPDAWPPVFTGHYVMHLHDEQTQTAGGGLYQFGAAATIMFK